MLIIRKIPCSKQEFETITEAILQSEEYGSGFLGSAYCVKPQVGQFSFAGEMHVPPHLRDGIKTFHPPPYKMPFHRYLMNRLKYLQNHPDDAPQIIDELIQMLDAVTEPVM